MKERIEEHMDCPEINVLNKPFILRAMELTKKHGHLNQVTIYDYPKYYEDLYSKAWKFLGGQRSVGQEGDP